MRFIQSVFSPSAVAGEATRPTTACVLGALPEDWFNLVKQHFAESYELNRLQLTKRTI